MEPIKKACECCLKREAMHVGWFGIEICDVCQSSNVGYISIVINRLKGLVGEYERLLYPECTCVEKAPPGISSHEIECRLHSLNLPLREVKKMLPPRTDQKAVITLSQVLDLEGREDSRGSRATIRYVLSGLITLIETDQFDAIDSMLAEIQPESVSTTVVLAFLTTTLGLRSCLPNWPILCRKAWLQLEKQKGQSQAFALMHGLVDKQGFPLAID